MISDLCVLRPDPVNQGADPDQRSPRSVGGRRNEIGHRDGNCAVADDLAITPPPALSKSSAVLRELEGGIMNFTYDVLAGRVVFGVGVSSAQVGRRGSRARKASRVLVVARRERRRYWPPR